MDERQTPHMSLGARGTFHGLRRYTFARNDLLFTMSDNTRMQTARGRDALHARIHFTDEQLGKAGRYRWWSQTESNRRPPACKAGALPTELWPRASQYKLARRAAARAWLVQPAFATLRRGSHRFAARAKAGGPGKI